MKKYTFDSSSKKFTCPLCGKRRFVLFIDAQGKYLSNEYGKCDRENSCGYLSYPDKEIEINLKPIPILQPKEVSYIDESIVDASLKKYATNQLYRYLITVFEEQEVINVFKMYKVGTSKHWGGSTVFWQIDTNGKIRSGKVILYSKETGKRIKDSYSHITWVHKLCNLKDYNLEQVMFGSHLLNEYPEKTVCLVESEKTAIIMTIFNPKYLWLAVGSLGLLSYERLKILKGRDVILYPDTDGHNKWKEKAEKISKQMAQKIYVSELTLNQTFDSDPREGFDIADVVLG